MEGRAWERKLFPEESGTRGRKTNVWGVRGDCVYVCARAYVHACLHTKQIMFISLRPRTYNKCSLTQVLKGNFSGKPVGSDDITMPVTNDFTTGTSIAGHTSKQPE